MNLEKSRGHRLWRGLEMRGGVAIGLAVLALCACKKPDAAPSSLAALGAEAGQRVNQAVAVVGNGVASASATVQQNLDTATTLPNLSVKGLASEAQSNMQTAASETGGMVNQATRATGQGLEVAGKKLQAVAASDPYDASSEHSDASK